MSDNQAVARPQSVRALMDKWGVTCLDPLLESVRVAILCETTREVADESVEIARDAFSLLAHLQQGTDHG